MSASVLAPGSRGRGFVLARRPIPIVASAGSLIPVAGLALIFALNTSHARPLALAGAAAVGGLGGALSLVIHELGHVRAARRVAGIRARRVALIWMGAGTEFEGAYRSGRDQARVAIAGPVFSLLFAAGLTASLAAPAPHTLKYGILALALLNVAIAVASLLPVHPLDGHKLVVGLLWSALGSEARARALVRRTGKSLVALDVLLALVVTIEKPTVGAVVLVLGVTIYAQKRLAGRRPSLPKPVG